MTKGKMIKKKSKRLTCHKKYKIQRKVREHNRKERKEAKKSGNSKFKQAKKDPGVPNCPFKEEVLQEAERRKKAAEEMKEKQKRKRLEELMKRRKIADGSGIGAGNKTGVTTERDLVKNAEKRAKEFDAVNGGASGSGFGVDAASSTKDPSRMYIKEFKKVVEAADVIIQVLDARDPLRSRCPQVESAVISAGTSKRLVLLLNKVDLVPRDVVEKWLKYLRNEFPTLAFKASTQNQKENLARSKIDFNSASDQLLQSSQCLGAETLMKLLGNYSRSLDVKTAIRVGVVGFPNVGKSSVINSLKRAQACDTGSVPGMTKQMQEVKLDKNIKMIDSPGIVMSSSVDPVERVLRNCTRLDLAGVEASLVVEHILKRCSTQQIMLQYGIPNFKDTSEFLTMMAQKMGRLKKGGIPDVEKAAFKVVEDWNTGKIRYYTQPPEEHSLSHHLTAEIVTSMSSAFDLTQVDDLQTLTLQKLKGADAAKEIVLASQGLTDGDMDEEKTMENDDDDEWEDDDDDDDDEDNDDDKQEMVDDLAMEVDKLKKNADTVVVGPSPSVSKKSLLRKSKGADVAERLAEKKRQTKVRFATKLVSSDDAAGNDATSGLRKGGKAAAAAVGRGAAAAAAADALGDRANDALKKQFKKMKKERKRSDKVATGLADGLDKAFASLGGGGGSGKGASGNVRKIGDDDDYDFGVL